MGGEAAVEAVVAAEVEVDRDSHQEEVEEEVEEVVLVAEDEPSQRLPSRRALRRSMAGGVESGEERQRGE